MVNYEDPGIVEEFLKDMYKSMELYKETHEIDAVELQAGSPGAGLSRQYLDCLIYGNFKRTQEPDGPIDIDPQTGKRKRKPDGFVNRIDVLTGDAKDRTLVIKNIDYFNHIISLGFKIGVSILIYLLLLIFVGKDINLTILFKNILVKSLVSH